jgi:hypothetical protein
MPGLGRLYEWDDQNLEYKLPRKAVPSSVTSRYWWTPEIVDQGEKPYCVGYSGYTWLRCGPVYNKPDLTPDQLYKIAQDNDEWPGDDYEGSSGLGLMKGLKDRGYVKEYRWALDADTAMAWVLTTGPVLAGTNWFSGMTEPDKYGYLHATGANEGGHEWLISGASRTKLNPDRSIGAFRMTNTWGKDWGDGGRAWVTKREFDALLKDQGDCVTPTEILLTTGKVAKAPLVKTAAAWELVTA